MEIIITMYTFKDGRRNMILKLAHPTFVLGLLIKIENDIGNHLVIIERNVFHQPWVKTT